MATQDSVSAPHFIQHVHRSIQDTSSTIYHGLISKKLRFVQRIQEITKEFMASAEKKEPTALPKRQLFEHEKSILQPLSSEIQKYGNRHLLHTFMEMKDSAETHQARYEVAHEHVAKLVFLSHQNSSHT